jgi:DNA-binding CsgD family transcriptional regulator
VSSTDIRIGRKRYYLNKEVKMPGKEILSAAGVKGGSAPKHRWTEEEREIVRRDYKGTNASSRAIAAELGVTEFAVKGQAAKLGLMQQKSPNWTQEEYRTLRENVHRKSIGQIAKMLGRSTNAVKVKATRLKLKLRKRDGWYTKTEVMEICGVDHRKVQEWIDSGALPAAWHFGNKPGGPGLASWHIEYEDLRNFLLVNCGELLGRNVDLQQVVWIVSHLPKQWEVCPHRKWNIDNHNVGTCANPACEEIRQFPFEAGEVKVLRESKLRRQKRPRWRLNASKK